MEKNHSWFPKEQQDDEVEMKVTHGTVITLIIYIEWWR